MKKRYKIKGTNRFSDYVKLILEQEDVVQNKEKFDPFSIMKDAGGIVKRMQQEAVLVGQPDTITIPYEEWEKHQYKIDDVVWIDIISES